MLLSVKNFLIDEILREPAIFLGLIAACGLILQRKTFSDTVSGVMKTMLGVVILSQGTGILVGAILPLQAAFSKLYNVPEAQAIVANHAAFLTEYGNVFGTVMLSAFLINVAVARFTPIRHIFLTGHMLFWFPFIFSAVGVGLGMKGAALIAFATFWTALYMVVAPALIKPFVKRVTGEDSFTLGHPTIGLSLVAGFVGMALGNRKKSTEDITFPASLEFLREITITSAVVMFLVYIVVGLLVGTDAKTIYNTQKSIFTFSIIQALMFGCGLTILLLGVRMMLAEIIPAFKGIADRWIPNAIPALDCPILFPYAPNAVLIGFITSMVVSTVMLVYMGSQGLLQFAILPLTITCFFEIGTAAVIANGTGGLRGAILGSAVAGVMMIGLMIISIPVFRTTIADWMLIFGGNDFSLWGWLAARLSGMF